VLADLRFAITLVAALTVVVAAVAMVIQDDLGRLVAAGAIQDGAIALLALATPPGPDASGRIWLLLACCGRTALAGVLLALAVNGDTRRVSELGGWLRRAPILGIALGLAVAGSYGWPAYVAGGSPGDAVSGWPASLAFETRRIIVDQAIVGPLSTVVLVGAFASALAFVRLLVIGVRRPLRLDPAIHTVHSEWPPVFVASRRRPWTWRPNRALLASLVALVLAGVPVALGLGLSILPEAARSPGPFGP
jgi:formate hydrogenlyase subunit 3/multisubunit Na+/H+ antiporter MnhD subunit